MRGLNFNIIYLHISNIVTVQRSKVFNVAVHLILLSFNSRLYMKFT